MGHRMAHIRWLRRVWVGRRGVVPDDAEYPRRKPATQPAHRWRVDAEHSATGGLGPIGERDAHLDPALALVQSGHSIPRRSTAAADGRGHSLSKCRPCCPWWPTGQTLRSSTIRFVERDIEHCSWCTVKSCGCCRRSGIRRSHRHDGRGVLRWTVRASRPLRSRSAATWMPCGSPDQRASGVDGTDGRAGHQLQLYAGNVALGILILGCSLLGG